MSAPIDKDTLLAFCKKREQDHLERARVHRDPNDGAVFEHAASRAEAVANLYAALAARLEQAERDKDKPCCQFYALAQKKADEFNAGLRTRCSSCETMFLNGAEGSYGSYCPMCHAPVRAAEAEARAERLEQALRELRINTNRLCDRNLGGTYEDDCRRSIAKADAALADRKEPTT